MADIFVHFLVLTKIPCASPRDETNYLTICFEIFDVTFTFF